MVSGDHVEFLVVHPKPSISLLHQVCLLLYVAAARASGPTSVPIENDATPTTVSGDSQGTARPAVMRVVFCALP